MTASSSRRSSTSAPQPSAVRAAHARVLIEDSRLALAGSRRLIAASRALLPQSSLERRPSPA